MSGQEQEDDIIRAGVDYPAEHHFRIKGQTLVAVGPGEHRAGYMGEWSVYRKRRGGKREYLGDAVVASDGFASTAAVRAFTKVDLFGAMDNPYLAY
ncbi:hypothetical protein NYR54_04915 [Chelativorans sp. SCAU2101]|uniref:Uncharacterized protein n=1 Tax=Chelativorans petroleitrophicus TaxID=2975484 RepID=A0A9X2X5N9_9HYPH|nr:hypothetical protein [Chelativorans petroleitrophicus]MCT8989637.1 hypothetical protein [Chelativorans petroleitrophicus]